MVNNWRSYSQTSFRGQAYLSLVLLWALRVTLQYEHAPYAINRYENLRVTISYWTQCIPTPKATLRRNQSFRLWGSKKKWGFWGHLSPTVNTKRQTEVPCVWSLWWRAELTQTWFSTPSWTYSKGMLSPLAVTGQGAVGCGCQWHMSLLDWSEWQWEFWRRCEFRLVSPSTSLQNWTAVHPRCQVSGGRNKPQRLTRPGICFS